MSTIVIDAAMRERLLTAGGVVNVCDESGAVLGRFIRSGSPVPPPGFVIEGDWPSDEEIDRRLQTGPWHSAAEVEAFLAGLKRGTK